jgi:hypothetical protein
MATGIRVAGVVSVDLVRQPRPAARARALARRGPRTGGAAREALRPNGPARLPALSHGPPSWP